MPVSIYPFKLDHNNGYAVFPFMFNGKKVDGVRCAISSRSSGSMGYNPEIANPERLKLFNAMKINAGKVFACKQTHSHDVVLVKNGIRTENGGMEKFAADGLVTGGFGVGGGSGGAILSVTVADCLPVFLLDTRTGAFSVVHSGWKGTGIAHNALVLMAKKFGAKPEDIACVLGPCIQSCCYNVEKQRALEFNNEFGSGNIFPLGGVSTTKESNGEKKYFLNMQAANAHILAEDGVKHIAHCTDCTFTDENLGSFRREGEPFTKMAALAGKF
ncbi:hypothetical protein FACS189494_02490 [Spirochaetia bacterium]|nr:hypothetical protein FACS189494_02490 [Spirochaetia bacterium]